MYDAVIVGARCAGASLAIFLAQKGYRVLLLDRARFPSDTVSTHITGEIDIYKRLGVLQKLESAGAPPLTRMRVDIEGNVFESNMITTPRAIGLRRFWFDQILIKEALSYDTVELLQESTMKEILFSDGRAIGLRYVSQGKEGCVYGRVIIGADGRYSKVAKQVKAKRLFTADRMLPAYYAYFEKVDPLPIPAVEWYWNKGDIIFCTPTDSALHSIIVMPPYEEHRAWTADPLNCLLERIHRTENLSVRLKQAQLHSKVRGIGSIPMHLYQAYGDGWALVGDAGALVHPVSGTGMDDAVSSAEYLAQALAAYLSAQKTWDEALKEYEEQRDARITPQFNRVLNLLERAAPLNSENLAWLRTICSFPSIVHDIGNQADAVMQFLNEERTEALRSLVLLEKRKIMKERKASK